MVYQPQQSNVQRAIAESPVEQNPIAQQFQEGDCQPAMQQSEPIIYQQDIVNNQDREFVLTSEAAEESGLMISKIWNMTLSKIK